MKEEKKSSVSRCWPSNRLVVCPEIGCSSLLLLLSGFVSLWSHFASMSAHFASLCNLFMSVCTYFASLCCHLVFRGYSKAVSYPSIFISFIVEEL